MNAQESRPKLPTLPVPFLPDLQVTALSLEALNQYLQTVLATGAAGASGVQGGHCIRGTLIQRSLLVRVRLDPRLRRQLQAMDLKLVADPSLSQLLTLGGALTQARRWLGRTQKAERPESWQGGESPSVLLPGALVDMLAELLTAQGQPLACVGTTQEALNHLQQSLLKRHPTLRSLGFPVGGELWGPENDRLLRQLRQAAPPVLLVGLGAPLQEEWIHAHADLLPCRLCLGIGDLRTLILSG